MPSPRRKNEGVFFFPVKLHRISLVDPYQALSRDGVVDGGTGVAVELGNLPGKKHLNSAINREESVSAGDRVDVIENVTVVGVGLSRSGCL